MSYFLFHRRNEIIFGFNWVLSKPRFSGIVLYAPALALSAVTGLHFEGAVIGIGDISSYIISLLSIMILNVSK